MSFNISLKYWSNLNICLMLISIFNHLSADNDMNGANSSTHWVEVRKHLGQVTSPSQGIHPDIHSHTQSLTSRGNLVSPIGLTACLWTVRENRSTWRKPMQARGEHANSQKGPCSGPSCCEATVLLMCL